MVVEKRLRLLGWASRGARLGAIEAALAVGNDAERGELITALAAEAARPDGDGAIRLLAQHMAAERSPGQRSAVRLALQGLDRASVERVVAGLLDLGDVEARIAAAVVAGEVPCATVASRLVSLLAHETPGVGDAADASLRAMVGWLLEARREGRAVAPGQIGLAVAEAAASVGVHRRTTMLVEFARLAVAGFRLASRATGTGAASVAWVDERDHPAHLALRRLLRTSEQPGLARAAWIWLKHGTLAAACEERLGAPALAADLAWVLEQWHLALNPARRVALRSATMRHGAAGWLPNPVALRSLPARARRGFPGLVGVGGTPARIADAALSGLLTDPEPLVRHAAVRAGAEIASRPTALLDLCFDADVRIARSAALVVLSQSQKGMVQDALRERTLSCAERSPHVGVRHLLACAAGGAGERLRMRRELGAQPQRVGQLLALALLDGRRDWALATIRALRVTSAHAPALRGALVEALGASGGADHRWTASLVSAMGDFSDPESAAILEQCLTCGDARVRANAADALARRRRRATLTLTPGGESLLRAMCDDPEHRPRASAARALLAGEALAMPRAASARGPGERALLGMLSDGRPMHRVAGLWLAERAASRVAPLPEIVDAVAAVARAAAGGPDEERARRAAERLIVEVRAGWAMRAPEMSATEEAAA